MKTRRNGLKFASRSFLILIAVTALFFSTQSLVAQEAALQQQGESGLSRHPWQIGGYVQGGFPPEYKAPFSSTQTLNMQLDFFSAGIEVGKQTRRIEGAKLLSGRGEMMLEVIPLWLARYPAQTVTVNPAHTVIPFQMAAESYHGASITPFLLRWNFNQRDSVRVVPWAQLGCGLLWTNHKFPIVIVPTDPHAGTSVINFTPQAGAGVNVFNRPNHSVNFAMKVIHISNATLGDHNPGLNQTLQFSAGYSWWK